MKKTERIKMIKSMEYIARHINDEDILEIWNVLGVADGDIEAGDLSERKNSDNLSYYIDDEHFGTLMELFLRLMRKAFVTRSGLYCDKVVSK